MLYSFFSLVSSDWGVSRFTTDSIAIFALLILLGLPIIAIRRHGSAKSLWVRGSVMSKY
tara:strand:- start:9927 stop:10103 length:177 start_codon:yes stop_codon:yes gene_type:complete